MSAAPIVIRADAPRLAQLQREGWIITSRSWAAQLNAERVDRGHLDVLTTAPAEIGWIRELSDTDAAAVLDLDLATAQDYPGGTATAHAPLAPAAAVPSAQRRGFGVFESGGDLVAMTFVDIEGTAAEIDFTVVSRVARGSGIGTAVKAASVLTLIDDGIETIRTGGSADNAAILRANAALGFVVDEHWVTLVQPTGQG